MLISPDRRLHHRTRLLALGYLHQDICTNQIQNDFQHRVKPQFWWQLLLNWCVLGFTSIMIQGKGRPVEGNNLVFCHLGNEKMLKFNLRILKGTQVQRYVCGLSSRSESNH